MTELLIYAVYGIGWAATTRIFAGLVAYQYNDRPGGEDLAMGLAVGAVVALFWPVALPIKLLHARGLLTRGAMPLVKVPERDRVRQLKRERDEQATRIRELERQIGIK